VKTTLPFYTKLVLFLLIHQSNTLSGDIFNLIKTGQTTRLQSLVTSENANQVKDGRTALHLACSLGDLNAVKILLANGARKSLTKPDSMGQTPLSKACCKNKADIIKEILVYSEGQKSIMIPDKKGKTPLYWCIETKNFDGLQELLKYDESKIYINTNKNLKDHTPTAKHSLLYWAISKALHKTEITRCLIESGETVDNKELKLTNNNYLQNVDEFDQTPDIQGKMKCILTSIDQDIKYRNGETSAATKNLIRLAFCRGICTFLSKAREQELLVQLIELAKTNSAYKKTLCETFEIKDESLLSPEFENIPVLIAYIVKKINLCVAQTDRALACVDNIKYHKKDPEERISLITKNIEELPSDNVFCIHCTKNKNKIHVSKAFLV